MLPYSHLLLLYTLGAESDIKSSSTTVGERSFDVQRRINQLSSAI